MKSLESDPDLAAVFEDIKKNGMEAAMKYYQDLEQRVSFGVGSKGNRTRQPPKFVGRVTLETRGKPSDSKQGGQGVGALQTRPASICT